MYVPKTLPKWLDYMVHLLVVMKGFKSIDFENGEMERGSVIKEYVDETFILT